MRKENAEKVRAALSGKKQRLQEGALKEHQSSPASVLLLQLWTNHVQEEGQDPPRAPVIPHIIPV